VSTEARDSASETHPALDLKRKAAQGALVSLVCQAGSLGLRTGSMMMLARLLAPSDFGLVGMVTAITGFAGIFKEAGLSDAAVQSATINEDQHSMLFWINVAVGCGLAALCGASAPLVAAFYREPRLLWIMLAVATSFVFTGISVQHRAILLRNMRIRMVATTDFLSLVVSVAVAIGMAVAGFGYWALVAIAVVPSAGNAVAMWLVTAWIPGRPRRRSGSWGMVVYGSTITMNSAIVYFAYNVEKVLLGRFWGAEALGFYGRGYQLINLPTDSLQSTIGSVAFPALARVQNDPKQLRSYFLRIYGIFLSVVMPVTTLCALYSEEMIELFLGPKWHASAIVFRRLTPTILAFAMVNPFSWLMFATGRARRSLNIALVIAPTVILAYALGLNGGPSGVALNYSAAMMLLVIPVIYWSKKGTLITGRDVVQAVMYPAGAVLAAGALTWLLRPWIGTVATPFFRLVVATSVLFSTYLFVLLLVFGQLPAYLRQVRHTGLFTRWLPAETETTSV
jgi:PST family polysaccharide transporter